MAEAGAAEVPAGPAAAPRAKPATGSWRSMVESTEIDTRLVGMVLVAGGHLDRVPHPLGRRLPDRPQPVEPVGPERGHRDHGHRAWSSSSCRATSTCRSDRCSASSATRWRWSRREWIPNTFDLGLERPYTWIVAVAGRPRARCRRRRPAGVHRRLRRGPRLHRHARRVPGLARPHLPPRSAGADPRPARRERSS